MINELLNIKYPIICGAMSHITLSSLTSSVSNAGGLGILASGGMSKDDLLSEIRKTKKLTSKPFGVNLMLKQDNIDELVDVIISEDISVVTTGAGSPKNIIKKLKENNIIVIPVVSDEIMAKKMEDLGCDAVIVEGCEAGGHIGKLTTLVAVQSVLKTVKIPVIAAGGIYDGKTLAAMMTLGASGVQIGSRFLLSKECEISSKYKNEIIKNKDTVITGSSINLPVRCIENEMTNKFLELEKHENMDKDELEKLTLGSLERAVSGDIKNGSLMAGQIIRILDKEESVSDIIEEIIKEANETLNSVSKIKLGDNDEK